MNMTERESGSRVGPPDHGKEYADFLVGLSSHFDPEPFQRCPGCS